MCIIPLYFVKLAKTEEKKSSKLKKNYPINMKIPDAHL